MVVIVFYWKKTNEKLKTNKKNQLFAIIKKVDSHYKTNDKSSLTRLDLIELFMEKFEKKSNLLLDVDERSGNEQYSIKEYDYIRKSTMDDVAKAENGLHAYEVMQEILQETERTDLMEDIQLGIEYYQLRSLEESIENYTQKYGYDRMKRIQFNWVSTLTMCRWSGYPISTELSVKLRRLSALFILAGLYLVALQHLTNLYMAHHQGIERFLLVDGGVYPWLFWLGFVLCGAIVPAWWFLDRRFSNPVWTLTGALMVIIGGLCHLYVIIIGAQAYPLRLVSGYRVNSGFYDGEITPYLPTLPEFALGIGAVSLALLMTMVAVRVLPFLPTVTGPLPGPNQN